MARMSLKKKNTLWAYVFLSPALIGMSLFSIYPIFYSFRMSTFEWIGFRPPEPIGMDNYRQALGDGELLHTIFNTFRMATVILPISIFLSLLIAVGINYLRKGKSIFRVIYYLPVVTMPAAIALVWKVLYDYKYGIINYGVDQIGLEKIQWLGNPDISWIAITILVIWSSLGGQILILTAALQSVPAQLYEAAEVDGASRIRRFFKITIPMLSPTLFFLIISGFISLFQLFDIIFIMIGRGIGLSSTKTIVYYFYDTAFVIQDKGYGATIAVVIFFTILAFTGLQFLLQKKWVYYE